MSTTNAFGVASIAFWALVIIISVKYLALVMRADNRGEGGILALTALVMPSDGRRAAGGLVLLGVFGTALLYGDGLITPAISVLSAVEGFEVASSAFEAWVIPVACVILVGLFVAQSRGTGAVGKVFGPVMIVWFAVLGILGLAQVIEHPSVIEAINPINIVYFFQAEPGKAFLALGSIFLVVTGGEALYADMGHFGRRPIAFAWYGLVLPALVLNYFGQAALLLGDPEAVESPLYAMAPTWAVTPLAVLATMASIIASQALISGAFSLTVQAVQLDYLPRIRICHTSGEHHGQVYVPLVNWLLMVGTLGLVLGFQVLEQPGGRLRDRGDGHDGDHLDHLLRRRPPSMAVVDGQGCRGRRAAARSRRRLLRCQHPKDSRRWLVPAGRGVRPAGADGDVAAWPAARRRPDPTRRAAPRLPARRARRSDSCAGDRGVPLQGPRNGAARAGEQPPPQQGPPRDDDRGGSRHGPDPTRRRGRPSRRGARRRLACTPSSFISASWRSPMCQLRWPSSTATGSPSTRPPRATSSDASPCWRPNSKACPCRSSTSTALLHRGADSAARFFNLPADSIFEVGAHVEI